MIKKQSQRFEKYVSCHCIYGHIQTFMAGRPTSTISVLGTPPCYPHTIGHAHEHLYLE